MKRPNADRCRPENVEMNVEAFRLLGMAVTAIRQLEAGNPFAKIAIGDFRRALGYADLSEEYLATLDPLALPLSSYVPGTGNPPDTGAPSPGNQQP